MTDVAYALPDSGLELFFDLELPGGYSGPSPALYLDGWMFLAVSQGLFRQHMQSLLLEANYLGFFVNLERPDLVLFQQFCFLGMEFGTVVSVSVSCRGG